ncbi:MAG: DUF6069 family protein [Acidimicrobiia bacterium]
MNAVDTRRVAEVSPTRRPIRSLAKLWAAGTGIAIVAVASVYLLANEVAGPLVVTSAGEVTMSDVIGFTILGGTVGAVLTYVVGRFSRRPRMALLAVTLIALAGYAVVPFTAAETTTIAIWLNVFHVVVAIPVIGMLIRYLPKNRPQGEA